MSLLRELLLLFITFLHISSISSNSDEAQNCEDWKDLKKKTEYVIADLKMATLIYEWETFGDSNVTTNQKPLEGITFPCENVTNSNTWSSMCAINKYLKGQLQRILVKRLPNHYKKIINKTTSFQALFEKHSKLMKVFEPKNCSINLTILPEREYVIKRHALLILRTAKSWTESYKNCTLSCGK